MIVFSSIGVRTFVFSKQKHKLIVLYWNFKLKIESAMNLKSLAKHSLEAEEIERLEYVSSILKTISHPVRLGVIRLLELQSKLTVSEICDQLGTEQSLTSHHLQLMRNHNILAVEREGRNKLYSIHNQQVLRSIECLLPQVRSASGSNHS